MAGGWLDEKLEALMESPTPKYDALSWQHQHLVDCYFACNMNGFRAWRMAGWGGEVTHGH